MNWMAESGVSAGRMAESGMSVKGVGVKRFLLITNIHKDKERKLTGRLKNYIEMRGGSCTCFYSSGERVEDAAPRADEIPSGVDCVMVLGGDTRCLGACEQPASICRGQSWYPWLSVRTGGGQCVCRN